VALAATANGSFTASLTVSGAAAHPLLGTASGFEPPPPRRPGPQGGRHPRRGSSEIKTNALKV
jgi:hypothetical protein